VIAHYDLGGAGQVVGRDYDPWSVAWRLLKAVGGWAWTVAMFGLATSLVRHRPKRATGEPKAPGRQDAALVDRVASYAKEAVLPFYVLHQTPIVIIAFYVVQWRVGILPKYLTISLASLIVTVVVYDLCVRRTNVTRVLFGMPPIKAEPDPAGPPGDRLGEPRHVN
jgi:glucans biosynthesis protein C